MSLTCAHYDSSYKSEFERGWVGGEDDGRISRIGAGWRGGDGRLRNLGSDSTLLASPRSSTSTATVLSPASSSATSVSIRRRRLVGSAGGSRTGQTQYQSVRKAAN